MVDSSYIYYSSGNYKKSLDINMKILEVGQRLKNPYYIHQGYRYLGYDYMSLSDTLMAKENFEKSEKYAKLSKNDTATAVTYMDLANFYSNFKIGDHIDKSTEYHEKSISLFEKIKDTINLTKAHYNAAVSNIENDNLNDAYRHLIKARRYSAKFVESDAIVTSIQYLFGQYYYKKKKYRKADDHLLEVIESGQKYDYDIELMQAYKTYSASLSEQGKFEEAYKNRISYEKFKDKNDKTKSDIDTDAVVAQFKIKEYRKDVAAAEFNTGLQTEIAENKSRLSNIYLILAIVAFVALLGFFFVFRNRKKLVQELKFKNKEYLAAKEETERLAKSKSKFFSTVSHELRTPLYGVIGLSSILLEDESLKKHEEDLKSLKFSANYLMALINDVLQINKIDANTLEQEYKEFDLRELVKTLTISFEYMRLQNKNELKVEIAPNVPVFIKGNMTRLSQILMNLVGNACKFTENGVITVKVESDILAKNLTSLKFTIKDTGIGIAVENQESIFEEFSQGRNANYNYQGTGLGLPIVRKLLALENSSISLESEIGKGSVFTFDMAFEVVETMSELKTNAILDLDLLKGKKVLVVEDNRINQIVTKKILLKNEVICTVAENGEIAVNMVKQEDFDIILMDINMPVKNGLEASIEIRTFNKDVPIVALTAVEVEEMRYEIFESGMNDIIVKPYDIIKFKQTILKNILSAEVINKQNPDSRKAV